MCRMVSKDEARKVGMEGNTKTWVPNAAAFGFSSEREGQPLFVL